MQFDNNLLKFIFSKFQSNMKKSIKMFGPPLYYFRAGNKKKNPNYTYLKSHK